MDSLRFTFTHKKHVRSTTRSFYLHSFSIWRSLIFSPLFYSWQARESYRVFCINFDTSIFFCSCFSAIYRIRLFLHTPQRTMEHTMLTIYWTFHCCMKIEKRASHKNPNKTDCPMHCSFWPNVDRNRIRSIDTFCAVQILNGMI